MKKELTGYKITDSKTNWESPIFYDKEAANYRANLCNFKVGSKRFKVEELIGGGV